MALKPCRECGAQVSTAATSCPKCGAGTPKKTSVLTWVIAGFAAFVVGSCVIRQNDAAQRLEAMPKAPPPSPAQIAESARKDREINIVRVGAQRLKESMKKPETFQLTSAVMIGGTVICYEYKARNSFNDVTNGHYVITDKLSSDKARDWNALCAGKSGEDYTAVRAVLQ
jgi:hypothetical protein